MATVGKTLYSLISLDDFKAILGVDDREDKLARFCLATGTFAIEKYCKRRLIKKQHFEIIEFFGDLLLPLREYPVRKMLAAFLMSKEKREKSNGKRAGSREQRAKKEETDYKELLEPELYELLPDCGTDEDIPFFLSLSPAFKRYTDLKAIKAIYWAGYSFGDVPGDLAAACLELASWNMSRYRGRRVCMTGNIKGAGIQGEHFELSMPENVKALLEPYRRKTI
jgi:hypothetical protein